jgi:hypothetical protein
MVVSRGGETEAGRETSREPREPAAPREDGLPAESPLGPAPDANPVPPRAEGLLTEGILLAVTTLGRAAEALVEPVAGAEGGLSGGLYWLGISAWLLAAALACEGARRSLARRAAEGPALPFNTTDPPPEADL